MKDEIVLRLNETLKNFLHFFTNDLQKKVLELEKNAESSSNYKQLERISNSLEQYLKKDRDLFYVGLLGSYSSGKSSTINSLLSLWNTDKSRKVSNNPTDSNITLITNQSNVDSVFTFSKEGAVSIRTNTSFQNEFLDNIVLMDTPGSGDPNIIESIVRDSLPLCDLILYTLNATAPFTDIDKPFLIAQQTKLKNIPILFVITRGEEFKTSYSEKLDDSNFDKSRYEKELEVIIERINETIGSNFTSNNFMLIDNLSQFNIKSLKDQIKEYTSDKNENLISLHNHKLNYFRIEIDNIYKFYHELSENKIEKCKNFTEKANSNIEFFNEQIDISKNKFKTIWADYYQKFNRIYDGTAKGHLEKIATETNNINTFLKSHEYTSFKEKVIERLKYHAQAKSLSLIRDMEQEGFQEVTKFKHKIDDLINYENFTFNQPIRSIDENYTYELSFPLDINDLLNDLKNIFIQNKQLTIEIIKKNHISVNKSLKTITPIDSIRDNIIDYITDSLDIIEIYYNAVKMYHVAAFSFEVKNYISELGLAKEFDSLESLEINKTKYNNKTKEVLVFELEQYLKNFEGEINILIEKSEKLKNKIEKIKLSDIKELYFEQNKLTESRNINTIEDFIQNSSQKLTSNTNELLFNARKEIKKIKSIRLRNYFLYPFITLIVCCGGYFLYNYFNDKVMPNTISVGLIIGTIGSVLATILFKIFDGYKKKKKSIIENFKNNLQTKNNKYIDESFENFKTENKLLEKRNTDLIFDKWKADFEQILSFFQSSIKEDEETNISNIHTELISIILNYKNQYTKLQNKLDNYFIDYDNNFDKITAIASEIKDDSIKPSFNLLTQTLDEIISVKSEIELLKD